MILLVDLEHGVVGDAFLYLLLQVERGELQQLDRLLQLRGHCQLLTELEGKRLLQSLNP